jgi:predicted acylesterase/phospholipase RssA
MSPQTLTTSDRCPERCDRIALVLQGGGALGAYQAGVFQALSEANIEPDWVTGVSIGAINCAIIAGNSKQWRLKRLKTFWERITERKIWSYTPDGDVFRKARNAASSWMTLVQGQSLADRLIITARGVTPIRVELQVRPRYSASPARAATSSSCVSPSWPPSWPLWPFCDAFCCGSCDRQVEAQPTLRSSSPHHHPQPSFPPFRRRTSGIA